MLPIGPLMIEHRLIERMINILKLEIEKIKRTKKVDPLFIDRSVDFIRTYADQTHHGKEEDILFRELKKKDIDSQHLEIMNELIEEHKFGRTTTKSLVEAKINYINGDSGAIDIIIDKIETLTDFYPKHIEKEDKHFFIPVMNYFTKEEQNNILKEGQEFDRKMIHRKYNKLVNKEELMREIPKKVKVNWIENL